MRIIYIPGIKSWEFYMKGWRKDLAKNFPEAEIIFLNDEFYMWWEKEKLETLINKGVDLLNDETPTIVLAHSFGGIIGKTMIHRAKQHQVTKFVTMASPHTAKYFGVGKIKQYLETPMALEVPTYTFGSYLDWVVPFHLTRLPDTPHTNVWCEHLGFLFFPWIRTKVLNKLK